MSFEQPRSFANATAFGLPDVRRVIASAVAVTPAPTGVTVGVNTRSSVNFHMTLSHRIAGGSSVTVWVKADYSDVWAKALWIGTSGVVGVSFAGGPVMIEPAKLEGIDRFYLQVSSHSGGELDAWAAG